MCTNQPTIHVSLHTWKSISSVLDGAMQIWLVLLLHFILCLFLTIGNKVLKIMTSQDCHHNYNTSQRLIVVRVPQSHNGMYYVSYNSLHLNTPMCLNFCASKLMCIGTLLLLMGWVTKRWTLKRNRPWHHGANQALFLIDYTTIWYYILIYNDFLSMNLYKI